MNRSIIALVSAAGLVVGGYIIYDKKLAMTKDNMSVVDTTNSLANNEMVEAVAGKPVVLVNGKPVITVESFEEEKKKILKMDPELARYGAIANIDNIILNAMVHSMLMARDIEETGINKTQEYQSEIKSAYKNVEQMINSKYFTQQFSPAVTEAEVKQCYEEHKNVLPEILLSHGGVKASELSFETEEQAKAFAAKVTAAQGNIMTVAQADNIADGKVKNLGLVHQFSMAVDPAVKEALLVMDQYPTTQVVKTQNNKFSVIVGTGKEEARYRSYEQTKEYLKTSLVNQKRFEQVEKAIEGLKKKYSVMIDLEPLGIKASDSQAPEIDDLGDLNDISGFDEESMQTNE